MIFPDAKEYPTGRRAAMSVTNPGSARPQRKPSVIHIVASPPSSPHPRGPTHTSASSNFRGDASGHHDLSVLSGDVENTDPVNPPQLEPTASELSFLSLQSKHGVAPAGTAFLDEGDEEAAEFGYPLLEDPESEKLLRQTNFQPDGVFAHHVRGKSTTSTSHLMGLVFRGNTSSSKGGGGAGSSQSDPSRPA